MTEALKNYNHQFIMLNDIFSFWLHLSGQIFSYFPKGTSAVADDSVNDVTVLTADVGVTSEWTVATRDVELTLYSALNGI